MKYGSRYVRGMNKNLAGAKKDLKQAMNRLAQARKWALDTGAPQRVIDDIEEIITEIRKIYDRKMLGRNEGVK